MPVTEVAWLLRIAHNVCLSHWDAERRRRGLELAGDPAALDRSPSSLPPDRADLLALEHALGDLTDLQRRAIVLREWRGLSYREVAAELGLSLAAVETLIFRARRALAQGLERGDVDAGRRGRVARGLDVGSLLAALKSALGGGGAAKIAATGLVVGATVFAAGSIPDRPPPVAAGPPSQAAPEQTVLPAGVAPAPDPALSPALHGIPERSPTRRGPDERPRRDARPAERSERGRTPGPAPAETSPPAATPGATGTVEGVTESLTDGLAQVTEGVGATVGGVVEDTTDGVGGVVDDVVEDVDAVGGVLGGSVKLLGDG